MTDSGLAKKMFCGRTKQRQLSWMPYLQTIHMMPQIRGIERCLPWTQFFTPENGAVIKVIDLVENDSAVGRVKTIRSSLPLVMCLQSVNHGTHNLVFTKLKEANSEILRGSCHTYIVHNTLKKNPRQPFS